MSLTSVLLPEPLTPVTATRRPSGILTSTSFRLLARAPLDDDLALGFLAARLRRLDRALAAEIRAGQRAVAVADQIRRRSLEDQLAAELAGAGTEVDHVIGRANRFFIVLDDDDGVAEIAQPAERRQQLAVVALMQADRRLVEHVEHAGQVRADLRRQADALPFAAGQGRRRPRQRQIADADVVEEAQPIADLLEDARGDDRLAIVELERVEQRERFGDRQVDVVGDRLALERDDEAFRIAGGCRCRPGIRAARDTDRALPAPPTSLLRSAGADSESRLRSRGRTDPARQPSS